jgi:hypothetical protein
MRHGGLPDMDPAPQHGHEKQQVQDAAHAGPASVVASGCEPPHCC